MMPEARAQAGPLPHIMISLDGSVLVRRDPDAWDPEFPT
eukprot:CAMPEP_0182862456 /NCGR_PEP_ID=MMETSP0034_2-20130328/6078_1 /TAXON_ID=156128 /ORGANISM="Nephroselmis pyriformis, Strain CCMP717" /LENGTH=38 /DNA_ID= /DNA_START= /DNA_END= /DNA_ORIENTATION=